MLSNGSVNSCLCVYWGFSSFFVFPLSGFTWFRPLQTLDFGVTNLLLRIILMLILDDALFFYFWIVFSSTGCYLGRVEILDKRECVGTLWEAY